MCERIKRALGMTLRNDSVIQKGDFTPDSGSNLA
jgi:hypothetical protein